MPHPDKIAQAGEAWLNLTAAIVQHCLSDELLHRQAGLERFHPEKAPIEPGVKITLGRSSQVGNVGRIREGCTIEEDVRIGSNAIIDMRVAIGAVSLVEEFAWLGHGVTIDEAATIEEGATVLAGASVGAFAVVRTGAEVNYDARVPDGACIPKLY